VERGKVVIREGEVESSHQRRTIVSRPRRNQHRAQKNHEPVCICQCVSQESGHREDAVVHAVIPVKKIE
jgi:hypothetical protein